QRTDAMGLRSRANLNLRRRGVVRPLTLGHLSNDNEPRTPSIYGWMASAGAKFEHPPGTGMEVLLRADLAYALTLAVGTQEFTDGEAQESQRVLSEPALFQLSYFVGTTKCRHWLQVMEHDICADSDDLAHVAA
uniref:hypothetical protein n=1 Tax=unclassified Bradyrhizobium TaxID=2631580 RepID=UPI002916B458